MIPRCAGYHLLPSIRGDVLHRLGRLPEAREEFLAAAELCANDRERALLRERALACEPASSWPAATTQRANSWLCPVLD